MWAKKGKLGISVSVNKKNRVTKGRNICWGQIMCQTLHFNMVVDIWYSIDIDLAIDIDINIDGHR